MYVKKTNILSFEPILVSILLIPYFIFGLCMYKLQEELCYTMLTHLWESYDISRNWKDQATKPSYHNLKYCFIANQSKVILYMNKLIATYNTKKIKKYRLSNHDWWLSIFVKTLVITCLLGVSYSLHWLQVGSSR